MTLKATKRHEAFRRWARPVLIPTLVLILFSATAFAQDKHNDVWSED